MPLVKLETTVALSDEKRKELVAALSKIVGETIGKPQQYMMASVSQSAMMMSGTPGEAAFIDIRSIGGLSDDVNKKLSQKICQLLTDSIGVTPNRVYLNFTDVKATNWGWNGATFG
jgi:phenylpyruvate tautomerase